jgi:hypothetical protein
MNRPVFRVFPQMCVKPRKSNVSGLALAKLLPFFGGMAPKLNQARLVRM